MNEELPEINLDAMRALFNAMTSHTSEGIVFADSKGCISFMNPAAEGMIGKSSADLLHEDIGSLFEKCSWKSCHEEFQKVLHEGVKIVHRETFCRHPSGRTVPLLCSIAPITGGRASEAVILTFSDLTERRRAARAEELLQKQAAHEKAQFETILKQIPVGILIAEASEGRIIFGNDVAKRIFPNESLLSTVLQKDPRNPSEFMEHALPMALQSPLSQAIFSGAVTQGEVVKIQGPNGDRFLAVNAAPIKNSAGEITSGVLVAYDISREREIQRDLEKARIDAERAAVAKSSFLANISHEIRTPLGAILGFTALLQSGDVAPDETGSVLDIIERNGQDLVRLIDEILDLSKVEAQKIEIERVSCPLTRIFGNVRDLLGIKAKEKGIALTFEGKGDLPDLITTDPARLKQILVNMVGNAIKFTERGCVRVEFSMLTGLNQKPAMLEIRVTDSGIGISKDSIQKLFQPFSQVDYQINRKFGGTGLGLAMSKKLAQLLGGDVELRESEVNRGSVFVVTVEVGPCAKSSDHLPTVQTLRSVSQAAKKRLQGISVLAADDSADNQMLIQRILEKNGARVVLANDGWEAVEKVQNQDFDAILMDIQMPNLDGYEATRKLRALGYKKTIIALSAHALQTEREKSLSAGCDDHITKPIQSDHLVARLLDFVSCEFATNKDQGAYDVWREQVQSSH